MVKFDRKEIINHHLFLKEIFDVVRVIDYSNRKVVYYEDDDNMIHNNNFYYGHMAGDLVLKTFARL